MSINIDAITRTYFYCDEPVPYKLKKGELKITPVSVKNSEIFLYSVGLLTIDKNSLPDAKIIQMSYLQFITQVLLVGEDGEKSNIPRFYNILFLCLGLENPNIRWKNQRTPIIFDEGAGVEITPKEFDEIKQLILHQNLPHYDDEYIDPDLKKAMDETDEARNKDKESPSLERKMAIITAHCGLPKREQLNMTLRSHSMLFEEIVGEVEFTTIRPVALFGGKSDKLDHWIFKKKKDRFDGYIQSVDSYAQSMGGDKSIKTSDT